MLGPSCGREHPAPARTAGDHGTHRLPGMVRFATRWYTAPGRGPSAAVHRVMLYALLAWLTVTAHAAFVVFVALGGLLVNRRPRVALLHVPAVLWGAFIEFSGRVCPLTPLENRFRALAGAAGYPEGFLEHYMLGALYPPGLTTATQYVLGTLVLLVNAAAYLLLWRRMRRRRRSQE